MHALVMTYLLCYGALEIVCVLVLLVLLAPHLRSCWGMVRFKVMRKDSVIAASLISDYQPRNTFQSTNKIVTAA